MPTMGMQRNDKQRQGGQESGLKACKGEAKNVTVGGVKKTPLTAKGGDHSWPGSAEP